MSQALRKLTPTVHKSKTILIFINQIRQTINSMPFANKETTTGGNALKFYASLRLDVRRIASLKKDEHHFGNRVSIKIAKNKVAPPFKRVELDLLFDEGISSELDLIDAALLCGVLEKSGAWLSLGEQKIAQGREQAMVFLKKQPEVAQKIRTQVLEKINDVHG
jgi:recombination protein RecA